MKDTARTRSHRSLYTCAFVCVWKCKRERLCACGERGRETYTDNHRFASPSCPVYTFLHCTLFAPLHTVQGVEVCKDHIDKVLGRQND